MRRLCQCWLSGRMCCISRQLTKIASNLLEVMTLIDSGLADKTEEDKEIIEQLQKPIEDMK